MSQNIATRIADWLVGFFSFSGQLVPQDEAEQSIRDGVSFSGTNILILVLAILIASLGLNTNSTAVIIGAMLISPLMGPIIGIGLGVGVHDFDLIKRCLRNLLMAAMFSVLASMLYFLISPVNESHSELLARTSPTIYDVLIGFFGGGAGIIALGSRSKGNVIPGVAIATALMPPLCTAGYGIATWQLNYFFGASYLFIINSIYIAFATFIGVKLFGYKGKTADTDRSRRVTRIVYSLAILTMLPSIWLTYNMLRESKYNVRIETFINDECQFPATQVLSHKVRKAGKEKELMITLIGRVLPADSLELALTPRLARYGLSGTRLVFIQGDSPVVGPASTDDVRDIYLLTQNTITHQQHVIDSLQREIELTAAARDAGVLVAPELKILFPQVSEIAVSRDIFARVGSSATDTVNVAMVRFNRKLDESQHVKLQKYLEARLGLKSIRIVTADFPLNSEDRKASK